MAKKTKKTTKQPTYSSIEDISKSNVKKYGQERRGTTGENKTGVMFNTVTGNDYILRQSENTRRIQEESRQRQAERQKQIQRNYASLVAGVKLNMNKDAQKAQSAAPVRSMINGIDRLSGGLTDRQKFELTRSLTTGKEPKASPVPASSAIVKDQRGILESYIDQRAQKAKEYKAQKDLTFQGLRENMEASGENNQFGVDDYIGIKQQSKLNQQQGLHDSGTDPRNMSDEGLEKYRSGFQTKYDTAVEDIKSLNKQKEMRDSYIPWQGWGNQVYDYIHDLAIRNEDAILNGEGYSDEEKRNAWWTKTELQDKYQSGLDEALEDARTFYNNEYIGGGFAGTEYDQQNMRELAYEQIMGEKYADRIAKMTPAQKAELDSRIDQAIGGFTNPYASDIDYDAEMQSRAKEAAAYQREVQQAEELQAQRSQLARYGQQADQTGFSGEYNPELNPEIKMLFDDRYNDEVPSPQGSEADKAYFWANNYQNYPELINSYTEPNKYMFIGAMGDDVLKQFNALYEFDKVNGTRAAESFMQALDPYLSTFLTEYQDWYTRSNSSGLKGFIGRVVSYPINVVGGLIGTAGTAAAALGVESAQDKSSGWYSTTRWVNALRSQQNEDVGDWVARITNSDDAGQIAQRVLGVVDSIGDNLFSMGTGTALSPNSTKAAMRLVQLIMSGEATSSRMVEMLDKNMDPTQAALYSIGDGVIEWLTEKYSLEQIMGPDVKQLLGNKKALRSFIARSAAAEGSEEVASNLLNTVLDSVLSKIYDHETEIEERYNDLIASGMSEQSAWQQALKEKMEDVGWDFLGGAFSGGLMAGGRVITNKANQRYEGKQIRKNSSAKQLYDLAMDMDEGSDSRKLAEQIQVSEAGDVQAKDYELGRLAQALAQETGEKYNATIKSTIETDVKQKLHEAGVYRNADEYAAIIANTLFSDGKMDSKDKQTLARDERAVKVWKKYNMPDESNAKLNKTIRDNTQPQRNVMDQLSRMTRRSDSKAEINNPAERSGKIAKFATPAEIREAESRSQRTGGQREVIVDGQFANVKQIRVEQENGKWKAKVELENGKTVDTSRLLATNYGMAQIINQAAISPEFYSERFTNLLIKAQEEGRLGDPDSAMNDATKIRIAAYIGNKVPQTGLDRQLANEIWADSTREHAENRAAQTKDAGTQKKGTVKLGDAEYGTTEWNEAVKKLDPALRSAVDYVSSIFRAADIEANITDMQDDSVYGTYNTTDKGVTINLFGKNFTLDGQATGRHNIVVTASHELTHWLKENSMAAYNRLEQYVMQQFAKKDYNGLVKRLNHFMYQDGLSLEDAMDEIVANSSDQVLGDEKTVEHIKQTDGKLFGQIRGFVQNLVERMKKAIAGMRDSASKDARFMLANRVNQINKLWTGAWDEALSNMAKETTQQAQPAEAQVKNSKAETAEKYKDIDMAKDQKIYDYDFLTALPDIQIVTANNRSVFARKNEKDYALLARQAKENALQYGTELKNGRGVSVQNDYTGRNIIITTQGALHSTHYENNANNIANAKATEKIGELVKYAVPINALKEKGTERNVAGSYAMAAPMISEDGTRKSVAVITVDVRTGDVLDVETYDQLHSASTRKMNEVGVDTEKVSPPAVPETGRRRTTRSTMTIAEFLQEVNSTHRGLLSQNVLDHFNEQRPKGFWADRAKFSKAEGETRRKLAGQAAEHIKINNQARNEIYQQYGINENDILFGIEFNDDGTVAYDRHTPEEAALIRRIGKENLQTLREIQEDTQKWRKVWKTDEDVYTEDYYENAEEIDRASLRKPEGVEKYAVPVKKYGSFTTLDTRTLQMDAEYAKAVQDQDWAKAEQMLLDKYKMKEMTTFGSVVGYRSAYFFNGDHAEIAKAIKEGDPEVVRQAAAEMAPKVPENAVLIPMPPHTGKVTEDTDTMILAKAIGEITGRPVLVALESEEHTSRREAKKTGEKVYAPDLGMRQIADIPKGMFPVFIDNVVGGGTTALAARDAIGHGITLAYAQSSRGKIAGAKYLSVTRDADGNLIPLSQRINPDNPSWKYSKAEESQALDAGLWLATVSPFSGLQTADERALQSAYKGLRTSISLSLLKQSQYKEKIRQYEQRAFLDSEGQKELDTLREKLENEQNHLVDLENQMHEVQGKEGYAGIMYSGNMIIRDFVQGRTSEQISETVRQMLDEVKTANEQIKQQAEELKQLEQTQAVKAMKSFMGKTSLDQQASMLRKQYNSAMSKQEIQDRLAAMALKLAAGQDIQTDAEELATDLVDKIRGIRSENLESLRGLTLNIGQSLLEELKAENGSLKEIRAAIYGSGVKIKTEGNSRLVEQWNEIRNNNQSLPDIDGMPDIDALHTIIDYISSELQASSGSQQFDVNMEEAAAICYGAAASVTTYMVKDPEAKRQITQLMNQIKDLSRRTGAIAEGMDDLSRKMEDVVSAGYKAAGWSDTLLTDMNNAIKYYNKVAELAAKEERTKVRKNLIEQLRSENAKKLYEMQDKYEQQLKDSRKARETVEENQTLRNRINTNISRLRKRLTEETDKQNIPEETKALARYLCGKLVNHDMTDGLRRVLFADKKQLQDFSERLKRMDAEDGGFDADRDLDWLVIRYEADESMNDYEMKDKIIQDLRSIDNGLLMYWTAEGNGLNSLQNRRDALKEISDAVAEITSAIRARGQAFIANKRYELSDLAERAEDEMSRSRFKGERYGRGSKTKNAIEKGIGYGNLTPEYFFKNLKNSVFDLLHKGFNNAENRSGLMAADVQARMEEIAEQTGYRTWDGKEKHQIAVSGGQTIDVTTEQLMALYATWQREKNNLRPEATAHLLKGGFVLAPEDRSTGKPGRERIQQRPVRMSREQLDKLGDQLTDQQREYVDKIVQYMSTDLAEVANETSMETYGIRKFTEKYYFPIKSWGGVLRHESNQGVTNKNDNAAMRQSFMKRITAGAQNTVEIADFTATAMKHIAGVITMSTVGPAVENVNKVLNYQLKYGDVTYNEGGEVEEDNTYKRSVEAAFQEAYGKNALDYLKQFMKDINGGTAQGIGNTVFDKLLSTFRKGAVAGSLSVALQQPLSYIRAATMINPKYLASAIAPWHWSRIHEEMTRYSGIAVIKDMGRFDMQLGRSMLDYITPDAKESGLKTAWTKFSDATTILPEKMDAITWGRMWIACKMEQAAQHPEMDQNSDEFMETVAERFNEVMRRTQVYDSVMVKSQNMRTKNPWIKSITSFMAEPTLSLNVLEDAIRNRKEQGGKLYLARAGATFIMSAVAQALVKGIMSSGRSPDDKKTWMEQFLAKWITNFISEANPLSLVPGYSDLVEVLKTGELSNDAISVLGKLKSILQASFNGIAGKGKGAYRDIEDTVGQVVQIFSNIPMKNLMRDARAMYNFFNPETYAQRATSGTVIKYGVIDAAANADNMIGVINTYLQMAESGYGTSNGAYYKRIYEAKKAKEAGRAEELTEYMLLGKGVKEETVTENLKKNVKADTSLTVAEQDDWMIDNDLMGENNTGTITTQYKEGKLTKAEAAKLYKKLNPKLTDNDVWWKFDQMEYNKETGANVSGDARYYRLKDAINANKSEQISKAVKDLRDHGVEQRKIKDELSKWKSEYLAGDLDTRKRIRGALEKAYVALGLNVKEVDTLLSNWKKDKSKTTTTYKDTIGRYGKGNIDLNNRKVVQNEDGSISTEESITVTIDGRYWVIPTIIDGKRVSDQEAIDYAIKNKKFLGKFDKLKDAEKYAEEVHKRQDWYYHK